METFTGGETKLFYTRIINSQMIDNSGGQIDKYLRPTLPQSLCVDARVLITDSQESHGNWAWAKREARTMYMCIAGMHMSVAMFVFLHQPMYSC